MSNDNIVEFPKKESEVTFEDISPDKILRAAIGKLDGCVILGWTKDSENSPSYEYFAASMASGPETLWLLERAKNQLINVTMEDLEDLGYES